MKVRGNSSFRKLVIFRYICKMLFITSRHVLFIIKQDLNTRYILCICVFYNHGNIHNTIMTFYGQHLFFILHFNSLFKVILSESTAITADNIEYMIIIIHTQVNYRQAEFLVDQMSGLDISWQSREQILLAFHFTLLPAVTTNDSVKVQTVRQNCIFSGNQHSGEGDCRYTYDLLVCLFVCF